ncbi:MAG: hypothetical protein ACYDCL_16405 [Myxococcales bacterium]
MLSFGLVRWPALALAVSLSFAGGCRDWRRHVDPSLAAGDPEQGPVDDASPIELELRGYRVTLTPRATYHLTGYAVETSRELLDRWDFVLPLDVAVAWGPVADPAVLERLSFHLSERYLSYSYSLEPGLPPLPDLASHLSNNHLIPSSEDVRRTLDRLGVGDWLSLSGRLVDVRIHDRDGKLQLDWPTSLSRTDVGSGSCEVLWVEQAERERPR